MEDQRLLAIISGYSEQSEGGYGDDLERERELAMDYYLCRDNPQVPALATYEGSSSVKYSLVHDYVNAMLAQMVPSLANDQPCTFEPIGPQDRASEAESKAINQLLMEDNNGFLLLYEAAKAAALFKNAYLKVWVEEDEITEVREFEGLDEEQAALIAESEDMEVKRDGRNGRTTVSVTQSEQRLKIRCVEPGNIRYSKNWDQMSFQDVPFIQERHRYTRAELVDMGYPESVVKELPPYGSHGDRSSSTSLNVDRLIEPAEGQTRDQDKIEVFETYINISMDGSLNASRWRVLHAEGTILEKTPAQLVPYVTGCLFARPFRVLGESLYEKLRPLQDTATGLIRDLMDMSRQNAAAGLIINTSMANPADVGNRAIGSDVRCDGDPRMAAAPMPVLDMSAGILASIDQIERLASKRAGASLDLQTGEAQSIDKQIGAVASQQLIGHQELQAATMLRTFSESLLRHLFMLIHDTLRYEWQGTISVTLAGQQVEMNPAEWPKRTRINVKTGMSPGERNRKLANLTQVLALQQSAMQQGLPLADPKTFHAALLDFMKCGDLDGGERYFNDPMSPQYQQVEQMQAQMAQQQQQMAQEMATLGDQVKMAIAQLNDQTDRLKIAADLEMKEAELATSIGEAEISARATALSAQQSANGSGNQGGSSRPD